MGSFPFITQEGLMKPNPNLDLTITQAAEKFGWSKYTVDTLAEIAARGRDDLPRQKLEKTEKENWWTHEKKQRRLRGKENIEFAKTLTVREVFGSLESRLIDRGDTYYVARQNRATLQYLEKAGFTRLDSVVMFKRTLTTEILAKLPREQLLDLDVDMLDTMSSAARMDVIEINNPREWDGDKYVYQKPLGLLIRELLTKGIRERSEEHYKRSFQQTRRKLRQLGFSEKDGPFMEQDDTERNTEASLMAEDGLTADEAKRVVQIALRRNWI